MNFLGIGLPEIALVVIIAVIVLGPERFPQAAVQVARMIKTLRGYATSTTSQLRAELGELTKEYEEVRRELQDFRQSVRKDVSAIGQELDRVVSETQTAVDEGATPKRVGRAVERRRPRRPQIAAPEDSAIVEPGGEPPPSDGAKPPEKA